jgi:EmrB/QacA subfamily drug resistance transporter
MMNDNNLATTKPSDNIGRWVLRASVLAAGMAFIDATALSVALPALQAELGASGAGLLWVNNAYAVPLAALLLLGGALGDRFGRKRVFVLGIALFAGASFACALAPRLGWLIAARTAQGIGAALMIPGSLSMIASFFSEGERGRAIGTWSAFSVITTALGPVLGGLLARYGLWRGVFLINLPIAAWALTILHRHVPESLDPQASRRVDYAGALAAVVALAALNFALIEGPLWGWRNEWVLSAFAAAALAGMAFLTIEARGSAPLLPPSLLTAGLLRNVLILAVLFHAAIQALYFFLPLNFIQAQGYDAGLAGLTQLPVMVLVVLLSRWAGALMDRRGPLLPLTAGPLIAGAGFLLLAWPGLTRGPVDFWQRYLPGLAVLGVGMGLTLSPLSTAIISAVPPNRLGLASGLNSTAARLAAVIGVAVAGAFALVIFQDALAMRTATLNLPNDTRQTLAAEAAKLGATRVPANIPSSSRNAVDTAIRLAFVDAFRWCCGLAAALAWLAAAIAASTFRARGPDAP